jgi:hypothetical protein
MYLATASDGKMQYADAVRMPPAELFAAYDFYGELNRSKGNMTLTQAKRVVHRE